MNCDPEQVTAWVDGELSPEEAERLSEHLRECAACRDQAASERSLRALLKALPASDPSAGFERRLREGLRKSRPSPRRFLVPAAAALVAAVLWAGGSPGVVAWELSRDHDKCFGMEKLPAVVFTSDIDVALQRLAPGPALKLPAGAAGLELVGGRHCPLADRSAVHLYYASGQRRLSIFVFEGPLRTEGRYATEARENAVRLLRVSGTTVGIVGENAADVEAFERALLQTSV